MIGNTWEWTTDWYQEHHQIEEWSIGSLGYGILLFLDALPKGFGCR